MLNYYEAARDWFGENREKLSPLRRKVFRLWLKIMKRYYQQK